MKDLGLPKGLLDSVSKMLKDSKPAETNLQEKIRQDNRNGVKNESSFNSAYASVAAEGRKQEADRLASFAEAAAKAHMRMGKSIVEQTIPKTAKEKELAAKRPPKDKITHADVLHARGVKLEDIGITAELIEQEIVTRVTTYGSTKRMAIPLGEQADVIKSMTRSILLSFDKMVEDNVDVAIRKEAHIAEALGAARLALSNVLTNSINVGNAVSKLNESAKVGKILDNAFEKETLKMRKAKMAADIADETIMQGEQIAEKQDGLTDEERAFIAKLNATTFEGFAEMDAWLKKKKEQEGTGKFEKKKISTGTVYTKKPEKEHKMNEAIAITEGVKGISSITGDPIHITDAKSRSDVEKSIHHHLVNTHDYSKEEAHDIINGMHERHDDEGTEHLEKAGKGETHEPTTKSEYAAAMASHLHDQHQEDLKDTAPEDRKYPVRESMQMKTPVKNTDVSDKSWLKTAGKKPGPLHNVAKGLKAFVQGKPEPMESVDVGNEAIHEKITLDKDGNKIGGGTVFDTLKDKNKFKPSKPSGDYFTKPTRNATVPAGAVTKEEVELDEAMHVFSGFTSFMKKHAGKLRDAGLKVKKIVHDEDSGTTEYHVAGPKTAARTVGKQLTSADKGQNYGGHFTKEEVEQIDELKAKTLGSYINKAKHSIASDAYAFGSKEHTGGDTTKNARKFANRLVGVKQATKRLISKANEEMDTPGNSTHQCAVHVKHAKLGEGKTLFSQHAAPDAEGNIAWYDVMFAEGIEKKVPTTDLEILVSESHMNHKKKK